MTPYTRLLLISTSTIYGTGYLDHAEQAIRETMRDARRIIFVPYALADWDAYATKAARRFESMGLECKSIHKFRDVIGSLDEADAIFVGGGNTFRLLKTLHELHLVDAVRNKVKQGMIYMGASAGSNVACPTIRTTNDMPIVESPTLQSLNIFPYQINPHYVDPEPGSTHMGETREERLLQYLEENTIPVIGLREGAMLFVEGSRISLKGLRGARIFRHGRSPEEVFPPAELKI